MSGMSVLAINPGATSTKIGLFADGMAIFERTIQHPDAELAGFESINDQLPYRLAAVRSVLAEEGVAPGSLHAVVGRGGLLKPLAGGAYLVSDDMERDLLAAERGSHPANLGGLLARRIAGEYGGMALVVDPVSVDEMDEVSRISGWAKIERDCLVHTLNMKAAARRYAHETDARYEDLRLIVAHLGAGTSVSAHRGGRMFDVVNPREEGPFSADRAGGLPAMKLARICFEGNYDMKTLEREVFREGGLYSYLGTRDLREVLRRIDRGDAKARLVFDAMVLQTAKAICEMAAALSGRQDAVIITGGMARETSLVEALCERISFLGRIKVYPGEDELKALAEGAFRVLGGAEATKHYPPAP